MTDKKEISGGLSRREFLQGLVAGGAALSSAALLASCGGGGGGATSPAASTGGTGSTGGDSDQDPLLTFKVTHQWAVDDVRDRMMREFGSKVKARTNGRIDFLYYPNQALFKARDTWDALRNGACDMAVLPLDYASGKVPELSITLLPCLVQSMEQGLSWRTKPIGVEVDRILLNYGVRHLIWTWTDGALASKKHQIKLPPDVKGDKLRAAGRKVEYMFEQAGASINSMPSAEIYASMATGVLDSAVTSTASFVTFRLYEQVKYINIPRDNCFWFMEEGLLMSEKKYNYMSDNQKKIFLECAKEVQDEWVLQNFKQDTLDVINLYGKAGCELYYMTKSELAQWDDFAEKTAWKNFVDTAPNGQGLLDLALAAR
jgi:TRAP-type transport system periplasmic protein